MKNKALWITGALLVGVFIFSLKQFAENVKVRLSGIKFNDLKSGKNLYTQLWVDIGLIISNPSTFETTLKSINMDIYFQGRKIGTVEKYGETKLAPMSENNIIVPAVVPTLSVFVTIKDLFNVLKGAVKKENPPIVLGIKGIVKTTSGSVSLDQEQVITLF